MREYISKTFLQTTIMDKTIKKNRKMKTFSKRRTNTRTQKSKLNKVTLVLKRAYMQIKKSGKYFARTLEYPLALCNEFGDMRARHKSKFRCVLEAIPNFKNMFQANIPFAIAQQPTEVIIDFLRYLHAPPAPDLKTYKELSDYVWEKVIMTLGFGRGATHVTVVIDKEEFLPPLREIIHRERKNENWSVIKNFASLLVGDQKPLLFGSDFISALQSKLFKRR